MYTCVMCYFLHYRTFCLKEHPYKIGDGKIEAHGAISTCNPQPYAVMTDTAHVLNGGGGGVATVGGAKPGQSVDIVDGWKRVAQINMKAREQQVGV